MSKKKIIQVVIYDTDLDLLSFRIKEQNSVDMFIILESNFDRFGNKKKTLLTNSELYKELQNKINYLNLSFSEPFSYKEYVETLESVLKNKLLEVCDNFDDIIVLSQENEFINFDDFEKIHSELETQPVSLNHINFWWGRNYFSPVEKKGSFVFTFSHLLRDKKIVSHLLNSKKIFSNFSSTSISNGWTFNNFFSGSDNHKEFRDNLKPLNEHNIRLLKFENQFVTPKYFNLLPTFNLDSSKKILITLNSVTGLSYEDFDKIAIIEFSDSNFEVLGRSDDDKIYYFTLKLPNRVLYGNKNYDSFISEYKSNEISRITKYMSVSENDLIKLSI